MVNNFFSRYIRLISCVFCLTTLSVSCKESGKTTRQQEKKETTIEFVRTGFDFGKVIAGETVVHVFRYKNTGDSPLVIRKTETDCGCTTAGSSGEPIAPGQEGKLEVTFNSSGRSGKQYKEIRIFANIPEKQVKLYFTAEVKPAATGFLKNETNYKSTKYQSMNTVLFIALQAENQGNAFMSFLPLLAIVAIFWLFMIRPQMKRQKELKNFRDSLKKGDKIVTTGGIYGKVSEIQEYAIIMEIEGGVKLKIDKAAVIKDMTDAAPAK